MGQFAGSGGVLEGLDEKRNEVLVKLDNGAR